MILGIGVDIVNVDRMQEKRRRRPDFERYLFTPAEISYCLRQARPDEHFAGRFAAKEALVKALGTGLSAPFALQDLEVEHSENGQPVFRFHAQAADHPMLQPPLHIHLSIAHEKAMAIAMVVIESR